MSGMSPLRTSTPDILTCIANLSSDAVFTPPILVNQMLETLESAWLTNNHGANIWEDPTVTFLDPFTKSGVFLREIVRRLVNGLESAIPDLQSRIDHILTNQVFGIATETLTAHLSRRSVYCSKWANGKYSITKAFDDPDGNIWFKRVEHTWANRKKVQQVNPVTAITEVVEDIGSGRCKYCGASEAEYGRSDDLESYAYAFIHTDDIEARVAEIFGDNMKFDVIIGNPPYQLSDGGGKGSSASPIYQRFIEQAKTLDPRLLLMVVPSKWFSGGKGLDEFRATMLNDRRLRRLVDFPDSREAFDGVDIAGGVNYFLWDRDHEGKCRVDTVSNGVSISVERELNEYEIFVRDNRTLDIIKRIEASEDKSFAEMVSARLPFNLDSNNRSKEGDLYLYASGEDGRIGRDQVSKGADLIDRWKVLVSKTSSEHAGQTDKSGKNVSYRGLR